MNRDEAVEVERLVLRRFKTRAHLFVPEATLPSDMNPLDWWTLMQHYRAPTRILDWTHSPLVALYFAVVNRWDEDGVIWSFQRRSLGDKSEEMFGPMPKHAPYLNEVWWQSNDPPARLVAFDRPRLTERMLAQQGTFTICQDILTDHGVAVEGIMPGWEPKQGEEVGILKSRSVIPAKVKMDLLKTLNYMNVTAAVLFPGIDGLGLEMEELVCLT